jgi:hypothetical protein
MMATVVDHVDLLIRLQKNLRGQLDVYDAKHFQDSEMIINLAEDNTKLKDMMHKKRKLDQPGKW